jgi:hypothetical protein
MIQLLATRYKRSTARVFLILYYLGNLLPAYGGLYVGAKNGGDSYYKTKPAAKRFLYKGYDENKDQLVTQTRAEKNFAPTAPESRVLHEENPDIDGPSQPEMSSFKPAGTNDMVNLFTGDFSYNIPLLDVGGYPVNLFYDGGIGLEQEASWVGLGWNINPGTVSRNMRGVPDDFSGEEMLKQEQNMKKNVTWGVSFGADLELVGIKALEAFDDVNIGASLGISINNHLGPALELGLKGQTSFRVGGKSASEKAPIGVSSGLDISLSSRNGLAFSPNASLISKTLETNTKLKVGVGIATSYNSRSGIRSLQLTLPVKHRLGSFSGGTTINFNKPSYIPALRTVITNSSGAGRFQLGPGLFGIYPSLEVEGYGQVSSIEPADQVQEKPMIGYLYTEEAKDNRDAIMDFTRFNDQEVTPATTVISVPQYSYDVFSIQGEGTGGTIRAYRNDNGYVRDKYTASKDKSFSAGADVSTPMPILPGHIGGNVNTIKTPTVIGEWNNGNKLSNTIGFIKANGDRENVYFRNPGESSVLHPNQYDSIGGTSLVRYKLGGSEYSPTIEPKLQKFTQQGVLTGEVDAQRSTGVPGRDKRTQVVSFLTASEASEIGLDKKIKVYQSHPGMLLNGSKNLALVEQNSRDSGYRKARHISQINVTESDGKRYIYGIPVYNLEQKDFSFTVADNCNNCDLVGFEESETTMSSGHITSGIGGKDGFTQVTTTPPYAHSFLLTGLLSPDYVDINNDGITEDDLGGAVKFNYTKAGYHKWRSPLEKSGQRKANSNPGNLSENKDDKGLLSWGTRESWFLHSVESKTMIAFFILDETAREDGKGASAMFSGVNGSDTSLKRLKRIDLYNKADLKKNGLAGASAAKPIKSVHFQYNYSLCDETPDNSSNHGKLTLEKIWFTYNGQVRTNKDQYVFTYASGNENPDYTFNATDRWGNYKPVSDNPGSMMNRDYPYSVQDKTKADRYASAWALKGILLPSGGQLEISYESDDYAFVQNKRAAVMSGIIGFSSDSTNPVNQLYTVNPTTISENDYVFIKVPVACASKAEVFERYLNGMSQLAFKLMVNMPDGPEYLSSYGIIDNYGVYSGGAGPAIWVRLKKIDGRSPLSNTAVEYLRQQLPGQAFIGYDVSDESGIEQILSMLQGWGDEIKSAFSDLPHYMRKKGLAQTVQADKSFVRLNDADGYKYGGGHRVKRIMLKDNWKKMTNPDGPGGFTSVYGQEYDYTTTELFEGVQRTISSGVASYEPSIGGEENPFQTIVQVANEVPAGPTSYGAIEMPVLDAFFPAPVVGYSKVTVTSIGKKQNPDTATKKTRSGVGRQVTEFFTAKDFPVSYSHTKFDPASDRQKHPNPVSVFFYKNAFDSRALSQGFLVATNDMHGKMRSQSSYAENDFATRINYTENFYRNTGEKGWDEKFNFVHNDTAGLISEGNMGIDIELMTDTREFVVKTHGVEIQAQIDKILPNAIPILELWLPTAWPVISESENNYRAVTTTKVISYHAVLDSVLVIDKGSRVSTKNLVYDAETGQVVVSRTNNEFDKPIYSVNYPAYWAYSGMGLAYKNIDAVYTDVDFLDGKIVSGIEEEDIERVFESGDELYITAPGSSTGCDPAMASSSATKLVWALDPAKDTSSLTNPEPELIFIDEKGKPYSRTGVSFRVVRSGKRNMLGSPASSVVLMTNPIDPSTHKLAYHSGSKVINSSAVEYKEKWQVDNDVFKRYRLVPPDPTEHVINGNFSSGDSDFTSGYDYHGTYGYLLPHAYYNVAPVTAGWFSGILAPDLAACTDHTTGSGNLMMVDGTSGTRLVWEQTVSVSANTTYNLTAWAVSLTTTNPAPLQFKINGTQVGSVFQLPPTTCNWVQYSGDWNSGGVTTATIQIYGTFSGSFGYDFGLDDISLKESNCTEAEEEHCDGYLEKSINPYRKGMLGTFRGHRNMVFYGARTATTPIDLQESGFLSDFSPYWNFNGDNNLVPAVSNTKWVWTTQTTRFNSKGMEVETKDALGIFTSAQYGYSKTLPVAIASNSTAQEMAYDGFEDYEYAETLNGAVYSSCAKKHIDFSNLADSLIIPAVTDSITAHTGKYVLRVGGGDTVVRTITKKADSIYQYPMKLNPYVVPELNDPGGVVTWDSLYASNICYTETIIPQFNDLGVIIASPTMLIDDTCFAEVHKLVPFALVTTQYIEVTNHSNYSFTLNQHNTYGVGHSVPDDSTNSFIEGILSIINVKTNELLASFASPQVVYESTDPHYSEGFATYTVSLCPGVYKIQVRANHTDASEGPDFEGCILSSLSYSCSEDFTSYASMQTGSSCTYTKPIAGKDSMMNPIFTLPAGKKMVFSAWVRETESQVLNYTNNKVMIDFDGSTHDVTFKPTGPVIEGWQRYEGHFTVPAGNGEASLKFINTSGEPIYFDDIRIHPFNTNMKSYVYDPVNLRLLSELDANNYASFYEYDEEGTLVRTKAETRQGVKTITESRSSKQRNITTQQ